MYRQACAKLLVSASAFSGASRREKIRGVLVVALGISLIAVLGPKILNGIRFGQASGTQESLWVADRYIPVHTPIKREWLTLRKIPKEFIPPGALSGETRLLDERGVPVFLALVAIPEGHPVTRAMVSTAADADSLSNLLRPGKVAVSFEIDRAHGVGGWIKPGDALALFTSSGQKTKLLFSYVEVLAVDGERLESSASEPSEKEESGLLPESSGSASRVVTVLLNPAEARALIEAREKSPIDVMLRSRGDDMPWPTEK